MDVKEIRRINLEYLISKAGSVNEFAVLIDTAPNYVTQLKNGSANKTMGDKFARKVEEALNKPFGWMDKMHLQAGETSNSYASEDLLAAPLKIVLNRLIASGIYEPKKSIAAEAVASLVVTEYEDLIQQQKIRKAKDIDEKVG